VESSHEECANLFLRKVDLEEEAEDLIASSNIDVVLRNAIGRSRSKMLMLADLAPKIMDALQNIQIVVAELASRLQNAKEVRSD